MKTQNTNSSSYPNMKIFTILFFLIFGLSNQTFAQVKASDLESKNGIYFKKGETAPFTGTYEAFYDDGTLRETGSLEKGMVSGVTTKYYSNGNKAFERSYLKSSAHGDSKEYYSNGKVKQEGTFLNGKEDGIWSFYYETGEKQADITFDNGVQQGDYLEYRKDGSLLKKFYFVDGQLDYSPAFKTAYAKGIELNQAGQFQAAINAFDEAIAINPTVAKVYFAKGSCYSTLMKFEQAVEAYTKAIAENTEYMEAYANRGNAKANLYRNDGSRTLTTEEKTSVCDDLYKAKSLGDTTVDDLIYIYCERED